MKLVPEELPSLDPEQIAEVADILRLLGEPSRLRILLACLAEPAPVGEVQERVRMPRALVSHHLRLLRASRLLRAERRGKLVISAPVDERVRFIVVDLAHHVLRRSPRRSGGLTWRRRPALRRTLGARRTLPGYGDGLPLLRHENRAGGAWRRGHPGGEGLDRLGGHDAACRGPLAPLAAVERAWWASATSLTRSTGRPRALTMTARRWRRTSATHAGLSARLVDRRAAQRRLRSGRDGRRLRLRLAGSKSALLCRKPHAWQRRRRGGRGCRRHLAAGPARAGSPRGEPTGHRPSVAW